MNNNDIEEDIKILENLKGKMDFDNQNNLVLLLDLKEQQAIENIVEEYKRYKNMYEAEHRIHLVRNEQLERKEIAVQKANKYDRLVERIKEALDFVKTGKDADSKAKTECLENILKLIEEEQNMDIEVGDRVTLNDGQISIMEDKNDIENLEITLNTIKEAKILKIERPKYELIEEKKELLTKEEKEFLKSYIKIIENLNNGKVETIYRSECWVVLNLETKLAYNIEVGPKFGNMQQDTNYTLEKLGL